jgi:hypothetical protein
MHIQLLANWVLFLSDFTKFGIFTTVIHKLQKRTNIKFVKIPPAVAIKYNFSYNGNNPPLSQRPIRISPETKSHSHDQNSPTALILRQKNPFYILLYTYFWSIPVLFYSSNSLTWTPSLRSSCQNFEWAPQLWYLHHESRIFRSGWFCSLIITDGIFYDGLLYVRVIFWSNSFSRNPNICESLTVSDEVSYQSSTKVALKIFHKHSCIQGDSWILDINVGYGQSLSGYVS